MLREIRLRDIAFLVRLRKSESIQAQLMAPSFSTSVISALSWIYRSVNSKNRVFRVISVSRWRPAIGFLVVALPETSDQLPRVGIAIKPNQQGKGVGASALMEAIHLTKSMGFSKLTLFVRRDNPRARRLYKSLGFIPLSTEETLCFQGVVPSEKMEREL